MKFEAFCFGSVQIDGASYDYDLVIDRGRIHKRNKKPSKKFCEDFGHTPLSAGEKIPWKCRQLIIGTGAHGALPVMDEVRREGKRRGIQIIELPTEDAIKVLNKNPRDTNAVLHVTC